MKLCVNGEPREVEEGLTVEAFLTHAGIKREYLAVELNRQVLRKTRYAETILAEGDRVEIVELLGGG